MRCSGIDGQLPKVLQLKGISKRFGQVQANDRIDFVLQKREIHALLGENGAGKTTLMNILLGLYEADSGEIFLRGERVEIQSPRDALRHGIGMVHQHFMLIPVFTVIENIVLGLPSEREPFLDLNRAKEKIRALMDRVDLQVNLDAKVESLSVGEQQRAEILKVLYRGAQILVFDEPTSVLTPSESRKFFEICRALSSEGYSIIFISHKLDEVMDLCKRITVLRDGRVVGTVDVADATSPLLAKLMVGREVFLQLEKNPFSGGETVLETENLSTLNDRGTPAVRNVSFSVRGGEILGVAGIDGNGQLELVESLMGLRPKLGGSVRIRGQDMRDASPREIIRKGVGYVPADRYADGVIPPLTLMENLVLQRYREQPFSQRWILNYREIQSNASDLIDTFQIKPPSRYLQARYLSGGNQQKMILARVLSANPKLLIAVQPTRGLDIGATEFVRRELLKQRDRGIAILLISTELDEILALSDNIIVMFRGESVGRVEAKAADAYSLGLMMVGQRQPSMSSNRPVQKPT